MAFTEGTFTIGLGGDYETIAAFCANFAGQSLTGNVTGIVISNIHETIAATISCTDNGYTITITSQLQSKGTPQGGYTIYHEINAHLITISGVTSTSGHYKISNLRFRTNAAFSADRTKIIATGNTGFHWVEIENCIFDGKEQRGTGAYVYDGETGLVVDNCIFKDFSYSGNYGIYDRASNVNSEIKNSTLVNCTSGYLGSASGIGTLKDSIAINCGTGFNTTGALAVFSNCASINDAGNDSSGSEAALRNLTTAANIESVDDFNPKYAWPITGVLDGLITEHTGIQKRSGTFIGAIQPGLSTTCKSILHIGDSISKLGVYGYMGDWLEENFPEIVYHANGTNNSGVVGTWAGSFWDWIGQYDPDILYVNSGMHDRDYTVEQYIDRLTQFWTAYKGWHPRTRVIWATTTHVASTLPDYETYNAKIDQFNVAARDVLDAIYGAGNYYWHDSRNIQYEEEIPFSDDVHPVGSWYSIYAAAIECSLMQALTTYEPRTYSDVKKVAYGVCKSGPADFKTGSPTISISGDVATFSTPQTDSLIGVGAAISYNDGTAKIGYIKPEGKISATQWLISDALGDDLGDCTDAPVTTISHPFDGLDAAINGMSGATYLNSTDRVAVNVELHLVCYMEQSLFTKDSRAAGSCAYLDSTVGDGRHKLKIYAPWDTTTQCNLAQFTGVYDETKYTMTGNTLVLRKEAQIVYPEVSHVQIYQNNSAGGVNRYIVSVNSTSALFYDWMQLDKCILVTESPESDDEVFDGMYFGAQGGGTYWVTNCKIIAKTSVKTNAGKAIESNAAGFSLYAINNLVTGNWANGLQRSFGKVFAHNNNIIITGICYAGAFESEGANYSEDNTGSEGFRGGGTFLERIDFESTEYYKPQIKDPVLENGETFTEETLKKDIFELLRSDWYTGPIETQSQSIIIAGKSTVIETTPIIKTSKSSLSLLQKKDILTNLCDRVDASGTREHGILECLSGIATNLSINQFETTHKIVSTSGIYSNKKFIFCPGKSSIVIFSIALSSQQEGLTCSFLDQFGNTILGSLRIYSDNGMTVSKISHKGLRLPANRSLFFSTDFDPGTADKSFTLDVVYALSNRG